MQNPMPPVATIVPTIHTIHGDTRTDNYRWLQDKTSADVIAYLDAENAYTKSMMEPTEALQTTLYEEMLGRIQETDLSVPFRLAKDAVIDSFERSYLSQLLEAAGGNMSKAARMAGMDRMYLHRLVQKHGLRGGRGQGIGEHGVRVSGLTDI